MSRIISGTYTSGVILNVGDSPVTLTASANVSYSGSVLAAVLGEGTYSITNSGMIAASASTGIGIEGGTIVNTAIGSIIGQADGIVIYLVSCPANTA